MVAQLRKSTKNHETVHLREPWLGHLKLCDLDILPNLPVVPSPHLSSRNNSSLHHRLAEDSTSQQHEDFRMVPCTEGDQYMLATQARGGARRHRVILGGTHVFVNSCTMPPAAQPLLLAFAPAVCSAKCSMPFPFGSNASCSPRSSFLSVRLHLIG